MKKLIATLFLICTAAAAMAQSSFNGRPLWTTQAVERATLERKAVAWFSQENLDFNLFSTKAGRPHGIAAAEVRWEIAAATNVDVVYLRVTGTVVGAFTNVAHFDVSPSNSSLTAGSYRGFIRALQYSSGGDLTNSVVLQDQAITVYAAVDPDGSPELGPQQSYVRSVNGQQPDGTGDVALSATASDGLTAQFTGTALAIGQTNLATLQQIANATQRTEQVYGETMAAYALASNAYDAAQMATTDGVAKVAADLITASNALSAAISATRATATNAQQTAIAASNLAAAAYALAATNVPSGIVFTNSATYTATVAKAAAAYPASNPSNYITAADVPQVATDATARATAIAASNLAAAAYSLASTNVPAGVVTTSDVGSVTAAMLAEQYVKDGDNLGSGFTGSDTAGLTDWTSVSGGGGGIDFNTWSANTNAVLTGLNADMLDGKHATAFVGTGAYATAIGGITGDVAQLRANMTAATGTLANAFLRGTNNGAQTLQVIIDQGGGNTIHTNAVGARQMGFMLASNSIASGSHGAVQRGAFTSTNRIGTNAVGATQAGKFMNNNSIGNGAFGAMQIGFLFENNEIVGPAYGAAQIGYTASGTAATNNAAAGLQLLSLEAGQTAFMSSAAKGAFGIGAVSVTSKNAIVTGDGNTSHGEGTITTRGYYEQTTNGTYRIDGATHARLATNAVQKTDSAYTNAIALASGAVQPTDASYTSTAAKAEAAFSWGNHSAAGYATTGSVASTYATKAESTGSASNWSKYSASSGVDMSGRAISNAFFVSLTPIANFGSFDYALTVSTATDLYFTAKSGVPRFIYHSGNFSPYSYLTINSAQSNYFRRTANIPSSSSDPGLPHQVAIQAINATSSWLYIYVAESNKWQRTQLNDF